MTHKALLQQAWDALKDRCGTNAAEQTLIAALQAAIEPLYTYPPAVREPLTNSEIEKTLKDAAVDTCRFTHESTQIKRWITSGSVDVLKFARAIEAAAMAKAGTKEQEPSTGAHEYLRIQQRNKEVVEATPGANP